MSFDLSGYSDVAERIAVVKGMYPDFSFQTLEDSIVTTKAGEFVRVKVALFRDPADMRPAICIAYEPLPGKTPYTRDSEAMNAETSAMGRCCIAIGIPSKKVASKDEVMARISHVADIAQSVVQTIEPDVWKSQPKAEYLPHECEHGNRLLLTNENIEDGKRKYYGYKCPLVIANAQCPVNWYTLDADGKWIWKPKNG